MDVFAYERLSDRAVAVSALRDDAHAVLLAGGTELVNWLKDGIVRPARVLDINGLPGLDTIEAEATGLRIGALVRMADLAAHPEVRRDYPAIPEALLRSASQQLRNMASMGGNLLQRTRLLHGSSTSARKYGQRVRCSRLPPIEAMLRSCCDALRNNASGIAG